MPNPVSGTSVYLTTLAGSEGGDVWAGGTNGTLLRYTGGAWTATASPSSAQISGLSSPHTGYALACASDVGVIAWNGTAWASTGPTGSCYATWAASSTDAWVVVAPTTLGFQLWHFDGGGWTQAAPGLVSSLAPVGVGGSGPDRWVLGQGGQLLHHP